MAAASGFRRAVEARDLDAMVACCAEEVVLRSPITFHPFEGRQAVGLLFSILLRTFEQFRYVEDFEGEGAGALVFKARVGDREVEGIDLIHFDGDGLIADLTVMVRPLSAAIALAKAVGPQLEAAAKGAS